MNNKKQKTSLSNFETPDYLYCNRNEDVRLYTFHEYCVSFKILPKELAEDPRHLRVMWDVEEERYIEYCEQNSYDYEEIY